MKQSYIEKEFRPATLAMIARMNKIIAEYQAQGFVLTVRQLYYQLVARGVIPNKLEEYKRAASIINDAKLAGLIDWDALEDRTREFVRRGRWNSGADILRSASDSFHMDLWRGQENRVFIIVEKEALVGVLEGSARKYDVPLLAARGYPSGSVLREFAISDIRDALNQGQRPIILHLGDHDPSGIDMTRDLTERVSLFSREGVQLDRIALTMAQVDEQSPPENPAKTTDSRFAGYMQLYGESSWELDALSPTYLADLISETIEPLIDWDAWGAIEEEIAETKRRIIDLCEGFE